MTKYDIILNWLPPANCSMSSACMTVLQNYLNDRNIKTKVCYWNILLHDKLSCFYNHVEKDFTEVTELAIFNMALSIELKDNEMLNRYKVLILKYHPSLIYINSKIDDYINRLVSNLYKTIDSYLYNLDVQNSKIFGFSLKLFQWIPACVIVRRIKKINNNAKIVVGGISSSKEAIAFLNNFQYFDYAIWGEGEDTLFQVVNSLDNGFPLDRISHLAYRCDNTIKANLVRFPYSNLNKEHNLDYDDFVQCLDEKKIRHKDIQIMIEGGRGCHWRKCQFCFLNEGYKSRKRDALVITNEIKYLINKYGFRIFNFTDNDIVGGDLKAFHDLLNALIDIKINVPDFRINMAEIITKGLSREEFRIMSLAGFENIQIGYESPSDNLLKKIHKKNTFASNLLAMKWCKIYHIRISGLNIIKGLLEETNDDILEAILNLKFERSYIDKDQISHNYTTLAISDMSRYYKQLDDSEKANSYQSIMGHFVPRKLLHENDILTICSASKIKINSLWDIYQSLDENLTSFPFSYELIKLNGYIYYKEYRRNKLIRSIQFELNSIEWKILNYCNDCVVSLKN